MSAVGVQCRAVPFVWRLFCGLQRSVFVADTVHRAHLHMLRSQAERAAAADKAETDKANGLVPLPTLEVNGLLRPYTPAGSDSGSDRPAKRSRMGSPEPGEEASRNGSGSGSGSGGRGRELSLVTASHSPSPSPSPAADGGVAE